VYGNEALAGTGTQKALDTRSRGIDASFTEAGRNVEYFVAYCRFAGARPLVYVIAISAGARGAQVFATVMVQRAKRAVSFVS
jgi:hypothetical protein